MPDIVYYSEVTKKGSSCGFDILCTVPDIFFHVGLVLFVLGIFLVLTATINLRSAKSAISEERNYTITERDAFEAIANEVSALDYHSNGQTDHPQSVLLHPDSDITARIKEIYADNVLSMDHYDEEFGESLRDNMEAELGKDITDAIFEGQQLPPTMQEAIVAQAQQTATQRDKYLQTLDEEESSLQTYEQQLQRIDSQIDRLNHTKLSTATFSDLSETWEQLKSLESKCTSLLEKRQRQIQNMAVKGNSTTQSRSWALQEHLYASLPTTYPVLTAGLSMLDLIQTAESNLLRYISTTA
ncbi:MAG: hypothetical protein ABEI06_07485 [Halobacteriaceae archaeon]